MQIQPCTVRLKDGREVLLRSPEGGALLLRLVALVVPRLGLGDDDRRELLE